MEFECGYCGARFPDWGLGWDHVAERHGVAQCRRPVPRPDWRAAHRERSRQQRKQQAAALAQMAARRWPVQELAERRERA